MSILVVYTATHLPYAGWMAVSYTICYNVYGGCHMVERNKTHTRFAGRSRNDKSIFSTQNIHYCIISYVRTIPIIIYGLYTDAIYQLVYCGNDCWHYCTYNTAIT